MQVQQAAAQQVEEAEGKAAEAVRKLAETEQLMVQQLKDEMSRHGREMEQVGRHAPQVLRCCTVDAGHHTSSLILCAMSMHGIVG